VLITDLEDPMPTTQTVTPSASRVDDHRLLYSLSLRNLLSFGPDTPVLPLTNLNILIGPNGSGKSNLVEALALLRAAPGDLRAVIRHGGGVSEWIWKGNARDAASLDVVLSNPGGTQPLRHFLALRTEHQAFSLDDERIENEHPYSGQYQPYFFYRYQRGRPVLNVNGVERRLERESVEPDLSILAQRRDPESYPEISFLTDVYGKVRIYREWTFGRNAVFREPQKADMRNDRLEEDFSNLGLFLNRLISRFPKVKTAILAGLRDFYESFSDFNVNIDPASGTVQVIFTEDDFSIPAVRLSDGTVRYLCLLAILCDPEPPPLICIEEPELGLHPDVLHKLADLLISTSERTQLIVTTHSDILVDAMTERPETLLVCEHHDDRTVIERLSREGLSGWLEQYRLGQLWTKGQIGGTRW
jgi:predicted ATPase